MYGVPDSSNGPTTIWANGDYEYRCADNKLHNPNGIACRANGKVVYCVDGKWHNIAGPAIYNYASGTDLLREVGFFDNNTELKRSTINDSNRGQFGKFANYADTKYEAV